MLYRNLKTGQTVDTALEPRQIADICRAMPTKSEFLTSLLDQLDQRGHLSETQMYWLARAVMDVESAVPLAAGAHEKMVTLLKSAQLKWPKIRLKTPAGVVRWYLSRHDGFDCVRVRVGEAPAVGRVMPDDKLYVAACPPSVVDLTRVLAIDPLAAAMLWGKAMGVCVFCFRELTDERSVAVGYGATCAERWGLPWGA